MLPNLRKMPEETEEAITAVAEEKTPMVAMKVD